MNGKRKILPGALLVAIALVMATAFLAGCGGESGDADPATTDRAEHTAAVGEDRETEPKNGDQEPSEPEDAEQPSDQPAVEETEEIIEAAVKGARENNPSLPELAILEVKIVGDWARVDLQPADKSTDAASAFLKKEGGSWIVFDFGTAILPESHPEAPPELFE